jgi:hypothetical protein
MRGTRAMMVAVVILGSAAATAAASMNPLVPAFS